MPIVARTVGSKLVLGAHVSAAGGVHNAVTNSVHIGGNAFALFLKSQRKWANPPLIDDHCTSFISNCETHKYNAGQYVVPHGSYLVNLAHPDAERMKQAYDSFHDDLARCHKLGIKLYNFHPGNAAAAATRAEAIQHLAAQLDKAHADEATGAVVTLLETMATRGNTIGGTFEDIRDVISLVTKKDRVGVCLDTCHVFAAGYDIRTPVTLSSTLADFDSTVGLNYLRALHVNDSKAPLGSNRDLHANIGTGFLGLRAFHALVNEPKLWGLPMVLETPIDVKGEDGKVEQDKRIWATEIKLLESLVGMDPDSEKFQKLEVELAAKGKAERDRIDTQVKKKEEKKAKEKGKGGKKGRKKDDQSESEDLGSE
ncbi:DNA-lyase [Rhizodiscina lignyota]|uniref:Apurinic-apyrimidinic endonuclease 1 n=1 Tax=Rhizodiscina lignyota TaxID=1504668 RepID=A0A9P4IKB6_9PEZI|nr:DNA-lyase [Rhizodiscina lignyota]